MADKFCRNCGQSLADGQAYCSNCGSRANAEQSKAVAGPHLGKTIGVALFAASAIVLLALQTIPALNDLRTLGAAGQLLNAIVPVQNRGDLAGVIGQGTVVYQLIIVGVILRSAIAVALVFATAHYYRAADGPTHPLAQISAVLLAALGLETATWYYATNIGQLAVNWYTTIPLCAFAITGIAFFGRSIRESSYKTSLAFSLLSISAFAASLAYVTFAGNKTWKNPTFETTSEAVPEVSTRSSTNYSSNADSILTRALNYLYTAQEGGTSEEHWVVNGCEARLSFRGKLDEAIAFSEVKPEQLHEELVSDSKYGNVIVVYNGSSRWLMPENVGQDLVRAHRELVAAISACKNSLNKGQVGRSASLQNAPPNRNYFPETSKIHSTRSDVIVSSPPTGNTIRQSAVESIRSATGWKNRFNVSQFLLVEDRTKAIAIIDAADASGTTENGGIFLARRTQGKWVTVLSVGAGGGSMECRYVRPIIAALVSDLESFGLSPMSLSSDLAYAMWESQNSAAECSLARAYLPL